MTVPTIPEGYVLVPVEPDHEIIQAMAESRAVDDEGEFPAMLDLLDFSGQNKTHTVLRAAYAAAITAAPAIPLPAAPVQGWVSVKDRLPEWADRDETPCIVHGRSVPPTLTSKPVLVALKSGCVGIDRLITIEGNPPWFDSHRGRVTHWMPLPPPPVGENE